MKKVIALALVVGLAGAAAQAQTNQVLSRNAVGYERIDVPASGNGFALVRLDFIGLGGDITISNMLGNQLPDSSKIILYDRSIQQYKPLTRARGAWPEGTTFVDTAQGFFLVGNTNVGNTNYTVYLMGEVPDRFTQTSNSLPVGDPAKPFQLAGFPYPVNVTWSNVALLNTLGDNSKIILFNGTNYIPWNKARGAWDPGLKTNILRVGQGFFIQATQSVTWTESKPYTWP